MKLEDGVLKVDFHLNAWWEPRVLTPVYLARVARVRRSQTYPRNRCENLTFYAGDSEESESFRVTVSPADARLILNAWRQARS